MSQTNKPPRRGSVQQHAHLVGDRQRHRRRARQLCDLADHVVQHAADHDELADDGVPSARRESARRRGARGRGVGGDCSQASHGAGAAARAQLEGPRPCARARTHLHAGLLTQGYPGALAQAPACTHNTAQVGRTRAPKHTHTRRAHARTHVRTCSHAHIHTSGYMCACVLTRPRVHIHADAHACTHMHGGACNGRNCDGSCALVMTASVAGGLPTNSGRSVSVQMRPCPAQPLAPSVQSRWTAAAA